MGEVIGAVLAPAIGVALSPLPIVGVILMLLSPRARVTGPAFVAGWVIGLIVVVGIVVALAGPAELTDDGEPSTVSALIHLVLGLALVFLAYRQWQGRPQEGEEPVLPKWMQSIDKVSPVMAFGLGALLSGLNPKNLIFDIAAGTAIGQLDPSTAEAIVGILVFTVIASVTVAGPLIWYLRAGDGAAGTLNSLKGWLTRNNATVMAVLFLVLGVAQIGNGIGGLFD